jgi:hypothetical protein
MKHDPHPFAPAAHMPAPDSAPLRHGPPAVQPGDPGTALAVTPGAPPVYDPADYRWVPVRRKPRNDGWTPEKQRRFIETLADTGLVNVAAQAVGLSRASAYQLRRAPHGAAFARAWDAARQQAAGLIEDIAFERAIEGTEQEVLDRDGNVVATRLVHDNRLLKYLLSHLKPERYGRDRAPAAPASAPEPDTLDATLRAMEPALPAPPEQLLDPETLADELALADIADGQLPHFLSEQAPPVTPEQRAALEAEARHARGRAATAKREAGGTLTDAEFADECYAIDPFSNRASRPRQRRSGDPG